MPILCYHAVDREWQSPISVRPAQFMRHCEWLRSHRRVLGLGEAMPAMNGSARPPSGATVLTFDDGFEGVHRYAFPTLVDHGLPATIFLVAGTLMTEPSRVNWVDDPPPKPLQTLSRTQVLEMRDVGFSFGSHSFAHRDLTKLTEDECEQDLRASREVLEDLLGHPVRWLAYPAGRHNARVRRAAARAGFTHGFALPQGRESVGPLAVPRVGIWATDGLHALRLKSSDWYSAIRSSRAFPMARAIRHLAQRRAAA